MVRSVEIIARGMRLIGASQTLKAPGRRQFTKNFARRLSRTIALPCMTVRQPPRRPGYRCNSEPIADGLRIDAQLLGKIGDRPA